VREYLSKQVILHSNNDNNKCRLRNGFYYKKNNSSMCQIFLKTMSMYLNIHYIFLFNITSKFLSKNKFQKI
jgi:hypothetical protein